MFTKWKWNLHVIELCFFVVVVVITFSLSLSLSIHFCVVRNSISNCHFAFIACMGILLTKLLSRLFCKVGECLCLRCIHNTQIYLFVLVITCTTNTQYICCKYLLLNCVTEAHVMFSSFGYFSIEMQNSMNIKW